MTSTDPTPQSVWEHVQKYRQMGITCIPTEYGGKKPLIQWKEYQDRQPTEEEYQCWFNNGRQVNIAALCGKPSQNLVVLDFDQADLVNKFFSKKDIHTATFCVKTNRGEHVYLRLDQPIKSHQIPGVVDISATNHLATLPPSKHPKGTFYTIIGQPTIMSITKKDFETTFWAKAEELGYYKKPSMVTPYGEIKEQNLSTLKGYIPPCVEGLMAGICEGGRNKGSWIIGTYMKNLGKTPEEILSILLTCNARNTPPLNREEIELVVDSVMKNRYGVGCNTDMLKQHCTATKPGECFFLDPKFAIQSLTQEVVITPPGVVGDSTEYSILIGDHRLLLTTDKMLNPRLFLQRWLESFGQILKLDNIGWEELVSFWSKMAVHAEPQVSVEDSVGEALLIEIANNHITTDPIKARSTRGYLLSRWKKEEFMESERKELLYASKHIQAFCDAQKTKVSIERLRRLVDVVLYRNTHVVRVGNSTARFWVFDATKFEVDWASRFDEEEEKKPE